MRARHIKFAPSSNNNDMQQGEWFESWFSSPYYSKLYLHRDNVEAQEFVQQLIKYLQPDANARMLDIACGEGRYAAQLAEKGFDVTGIDLSQSSIRIAQQKERENLHFFVHDMRRVFYINYFDYAFNFFTSFGYFNNAQDNQRAAKAFAAALKPGGILVLDYLNKEYTRRRLVASEVIDREDTVFEIERHMDDSHFIKDISFKDESGAQRQFTERVSAFTLADFVQLFTNAGCRLTATFGDYVLSPYHPIDSPRLIMIFKKSNVV